MRPSVFRLLAAAMCTAMPLAAHATEILNVDTGELFMTIQAAHDDADTIDGHTLAVVVPTHAEGLVSFNKNLTLRSDHNAVITPTTNTGGGDAAGWFTVEAGTGVHFENLTFDGAGNNLYTGLLFFGGGSITDCTLRNISYGHIYLGLGVAARGDDVDIIGCTFENIQRVGVLYKSANFHGSRFEHNVYQGKGDGNFLDYALDISAGARVFVRNNIVSDCRGVAASDGSTSAGFLVSTYFAPGTEAIFTHNTIQNCSTGIYVGYLADDTSAVTAHFNNFDNCEWGIISANPVVDADRNYWGHATGPNDADGVTPTSLEGCAPLADATNDGDGVMVYGNVSYCPWLIAPHAAQPGPGDVVAVTKANGDMVNGAGIPANNFQSDTNGEVSVWLKGRNRDGVGGQPIAQSGNIYYVNPGVQHQTFDFQFTPRPTDVVGGGNYYLRLTADLDPAAGNAGGLCPGSGAASSLVVLDNPIFDADGDQSNSWDDVPGSGDGLWINPGGGAWNTDDIPYVYSQSWHMGFGFLNGADLCPGDYDITWEVLEGAPGDPLRRKLAGTSIVMRVLDAADVVPSHLNLTAWETCPGLSGNQLIVDVDMQQATENVFGGQFWLTYDNTALDFVSAQPGMAPFTREVMASVDEGAGSIFYAVGVPDGSGSATADGRLARFTFNIASGYCAEAGLVSFTPGTPPTSLTTGDAAAVIPATADLNTVSGDSVPPALSIPADISVPADAGYCSALIIPGVATATDNCDAEPAITFVRSDGKPDLLDPYDAADSPITITWSAADACGNMSFAVQTVTVDSTSQLSVAVELANVSAGPFTRCITFELFECGGGSAVVSADMTFSGGMANAIIDVPCGVYTCITARDDLHTLRATDNDDFIVAGTQYSADFTGLDALTGGNINDDFYIDILDFGGYASRYGTNYGSADTLCGPPGLHADFSGNGSVGVEDFTFIQTNFLKTSEPNCCGLNGAMAPPVDRISVIELRARGDDDLARADVNHDGWLDAADLSAFILTGGAPCTADFNASGTVDVFDLLLYLDHWFAADPAAELAGGGAVDVFDLLAFLDGWFAGCP